MWQPETKERVRPILGRMNSSQASLSDGARVNFLIPPMIAPPDGRRLSLTSNDSASSSLSDIWAAPTTDFFSWYENRRRSSGFVSDFGASQSSSEVLSNNVTLTEELSCVKPGMENVPQWLKQLRLHKYTDYMMSLSYEEMISLDEDKLQKMNVTKGARRKILLSIEKLSERPKTLAAISRKLDTEGCDIKEILFELETLIKSPILILRGETMMKEVPQYNNSQDSGAEVSDDEESCREVMNREDIMTGLKLIEIIIKTMKKTTSVILLSQHTESKHVSMLTHLIDLCLSQSCYSHSQKQLLQSWKQKIHTLWAPLQCAQGKSGQLRNKKFQLGLPWSSPEWQTFPSNFSLQRNSVPNIYSTAPGSGTSLRKRHSFQEGVQYFQDKFPNLSLESDRLYPQHSESYSDFPWTTREHREHRVAGSQDWLCESNNMFSQPASDPMKIFVTCEHSADNEANIAADTAADIAAEDELSVGLENLCKAVTEQALE